MYVIRDIMHCKPGKVRPMVENFKLMNKVMKKEGFGEMRIMTDVSAEQYWTVVVETEVKNIKDYFDMTLSPKANKQLEKVMKDYHDLVQSGRREIYKAE